MLFSSLPFLFYFLPCTLGLYFLVPRRLKNAALLLCSLVFYAWGEPRFVLFMAAAILQGYAAARLMERYPTRRRLLLTLSAVLSLGMLAYCKYADFLISGFNAVTGLSVPLLRMALPIGISFYTFQILSYVIDVYRGDAPAQRNLIDLAAYIAMYPQLVAGPIVRYADVAPQLQSRTHTVQDAALGARRFVLGLGKKVLLANVLYELVTVYQQSGQKTVLLTWLYAAAYMLHVYFDFSGYSDMAIGLGRIMGFRFAENFRYPFVSGSLTEFWRRWHISLGSWFRDYVYIPLGGSRVVEQRGLAGDVALDGDGEHASLGLGLLVEHVVEVDQRGDVALVVGGEVAVVDARDAAVHEGLLHRREVLGHHLDHRHDGVDLHRERLFALHELEIERVDIGMRVSGDLDDLAVHLARDVDVLALGVEHDDLGGGVGEKRPQDRVLGRHRLAAARLAQDEAVGRDGVAAVVEDEVLGRLVLAHPHAAALHELDRRERHERRERGGREVAYVGDAADD